jgi:hypothetical protein
MFLIKFQTYYINLIFEINFIFYYLQNDACTVERKQLQLVGVAAMFIAAKYEEMYAPEIGNI